jgi:glycosyltransferase involved in cell wall biosynthesis
MMEIKSQDFIKVLLISFVPLELKGAGTGNLLNQLVSFLSKKPNIKLEVCTLAQAEGINDFGSWCYATFKGLPLKFLHDVSPSMIQHVLKRRKYYDRVLIVGCSWTSTIIALLLRFTSPYIKVIQIPQIHRDFIFRDNVAKLLYKLKKWIMIYFLNFKMIQPTLIVYSCEEESIVKQFARNIIRRPLGIELEKYDKLAALIKRGLGAKTPKEKLILLHVGDIHRNKFPIFAVEVMKSLKESADDKVELIAVGRIHERHYKKLREEIRRYGLENLIQFTGLVSEDKLLRYWLDADIFVLFSASEAGPFTVLEAMAMGVPVVATRVGIVPELEEKGMLLAVRYGDINGMVAKILRLWKDENLRNSLTKRARSELIKYDIKHFLETVYQVLISG